MLSLQINHAVADGWNFSLEEESNDHPTEIDLSELMKQLRLVSKLFGEA